MVYVRVSNPISLRLPTGNIWECRVWARLCVCVRAEVSCLDVQGPLHLGFWRALALWEYMWQDAITSTPQVCRPYHHYHPWGNSQLKLHINKFSFSLHTTQHVLHMIVHRAGPPHAISFHWYPQDTTRWAKTFRYTYTCRAIFSCPRVLTHFPIDKSVYLRPQITS